MIPSSFVRLDILPLNFFKSVSFLTKILDNIEVNLDEFKKKIEETEVKEKLKLLTNDAFKKNIFGAPTYVVNTKNFWGQDRYEYAIEELNSTS